MVALLLPGVARAAGAAREVTYSAQEGVLGQE